jgi:hypothetical protein
VDSVGSCDNFQNLLLFCSNFGGDVFIILGYASLHLHLIMALVIAQFPKDIWENLFLHSDQKDHYSFRAVAKFFYDSEALHQLFLTHAFPEDKLNGRFRFDIPTNPPSWVKLCRSRILAEQNLLNGLSRIDKFRSALVGKYFFVNTRKQYVLSGNDPWLMPLKFMIKSHYLDLPDIHYGDLEGLPIVKLTYVTETILLRFDFKPTFTDKCYKITKIVLRAIFDFFIRHNNKIAFVSLLALGGALVFLNKNSAKPLK